MSQHRFQRYKRGRWHVERERCRIEPGRPSPAFQDPEPIADVVRAVLQNQGVDAPTWQTDIVEQWSSLVGPGVARHCRPGRMNRTRLTVYVDSSAWLSELSRFGKAPMLAKLQERYGSDKIADIHFALSPGRAAG